MKVLVDTAVWSLALRKKTLSDQELKIVEELKELIYELRVVTIGPIRQELLSGLQSESKYKLLKENLNAFDDLPLLQQDYESAANIYNQCRRKGIQGSHIDFLICSTAINNNFSIFTTDKDFIHYSDIINIRLHEVRNEI